MNTKQRSVSAPTEEKQQSTKQLGLLNAKVNKSLSFHDIGAYPIELAKLEDETGEHWTPTYWRKGLLTKEEMEPTREKVLKWFSGKKMAVITARMIEINNQINKKNE